MRLRVGASLGRLVRCIRVRPQIVFVSPFDLDDIPTSRYARYVSPESVERPPSGRARSKLLEAAFSITRRKGYAATSVDELCVGAVVTEAALFHHFPSKDWLAVAAVNQSTDMTAAFFAPASYQEFDDPLDRVRGCLDSRTVKSSILWPANVREK
jgi:TetR/AcrR family transcriptional regulator, transcriptional repressor for nem operon